MNFMEAAQAAIHGATVARTVWEKVAWRSHIYMDCSQGFFLMRSVDPKINEEILGKYIFSRNDLLADDWQLVEVESLRNKFLKSSIKKKLTPDELDLIEFKN